MAHRPSSESAPFSKSSNSRSRLGFHVLTLFPEVFDPVLSSSLVGKARDKGLVDFHYVQIRDFAKDKHRTVDDTPYGGGEGMLMKVDVLHPAWQEAKRAIPEGSRALTIFLSPQGAPLTQEMAKELATYDHLVLVCGHYEGVDERFIEMCVDREISIGDYVLTGGELPAMVLIDVVTRLIPGVVGNEKSLTEETFEKGLLKYPQYTRPREYEGRSVPEVLLGGDHGVIARWRGERMRERTAARRPDLLRPRDKSPKDSD